MVHSMKYLFVTFVLVVSACSASGEFSVGTPTVENATEGLIEDTLADQIGQLTHFGQRCVAAREQQAIVQRKPLARFDLVADRFQDGGRGAKHEGLGFWG